VSISEAPAAELILAEAREATESRLELVAARLAASVPAPLGAAFAYALRSPGKRVRPALVIAAYRAAAGGSAAIAGVAAAVEIVHTYSLVHDDLPCMDDDDLRRGRPTMHRQFDVHTATRVGFLLVPVAAQVLAESATELGLAEPLLGAMAEALFEAGGIEGMVGGQWLDLEAERRRLDLPELIGVHRGKTGALIKASCVLGGLAAQASPTGMDALQHFGAEIGLAFQIADDVLDVIGTSDQLGKTAGRDEALNKSTYAQLLGVEGARAEAERLARSAVGHLERTGLASPALATLAHYIVTRNS
jgi:geranylgeranyl pyrophosphate synthase